MDNHFTVTVAYITAIAAIIAPTISAIIHAIKEFQIAKLNSTVSARLELCEKFSDTYSKCQYGPEKKGYALDFYKSSNKLIAVCRHRSVRRALFKLANQVLKNGASKDTDRLYERCIQLLSKEF